MLLLLIALISALGLEGVGRGCGEPQRSTERSLCPFCPFCPCRGVRVIVQATSHLWIPVLWG